MTELISKAVIDATITYIHQKGWQDFQVFDLVIHNIIPVPLPFINKHEFLGKALQVWHHDTLSSLPLFDRQTTLHERFFEVFIIRFEILNPYKKFLMQVCASPRSLPENLRHCSVLWWQSISELYNHVIVGQSDQNLMRYKKAFIWFYAKTLPTWFADHNADLAATMSAWDANTHKFLDLLSRLP